jgi:hypothetical protein
MNRKTILALVGAIALAVPVPVAALAAGSGPAVTVRIRTFSKTLTRAVVHGQKGSIRKGGTPKGVCPGKSAAGALNAATHGHWKGKFFRGLKDIFVTSILGVTPKSPDFWGFFVDGKLASKGVCETKLRTGEKLLFKEIK